MPPGSTPRTRSALLFAVALGCLGLLPTSVQAQRLGVIGIGAFGRLGSVPAAFNPGVPVAVEAAVQWPLVGALHLATSADLTVQRIVTQTSFATGEPGPDQVVHRSYAFNVVHFGVGPGFAVHASPRLLISGSAQAMALVPSWNSASVGTCGGSCTLLSPSSNDQQAEFHMGVGGRLRFTFGSRKERLGFEILGIVGPRHTASRIPLTSLALMFVVGAS
jgi:hypothetical protein